MPDATNLLACSTVSLKFKGDSKEKLRKSDINLLPSAALPDIALIAISNCSYSPAKVVTSFIKAPIPTIPKDKPLNTAKDEAVLLSLLEKSAVAALVSLNSFLNF